MESKWMCVFALVVVAAALPMLQATDEHVTVLTSDNFDDHVGGDKAALVEFYAPWCGHCKRLAPEYEKLAEALKAQKGVVIAKVDCDDHKPLCSRFGIQGFPTIKWFPKGSLEPKDYSGGRTTDALLEFVNTEAGVKGKVATAPSEVVVLTPANFDKIVKDTTKDVLVEFYAPWCGHCKSLAPVYEKVAAAFKAENDVVVAKVDCDAHKELGERYGVSGYPTLKFFPKDNKEGEEYSLGRDVNAFVEFLNERAGTARTFSGALSSDAGIVAAFDDVITEFLSATPEERSSIYLKGEAEAARLEGKAAGYGQVYLKALKSMIDKGEGYAKKESERLTRLLSKSVSPNKVDEFTVKKNILSAIAEKQ